MIFYTLQGPTHKLEIFEDKMKLSKKAWIKWMRRKDSVTAWPLEELSHFEVTIPKFGPISGKVEWTTFDNQHGSFRFTTHSAMMKKIELYMQKLILRNHQRKNNRVEEPAFVKKKSKKLKAA